MHIFVYRKCFAKAEPLDNWEGMLDWLYKAIRNADLKVKVSKIKEFVFVKLREQLHIYINDDKY